MVPPIVAVTVLVVHVTATVETLALAVPLPAVTTHVCAGFAGCVLTVTLYAPLTAFLNVNGTVPVPVIASV